MFEDVCPYYMSIGMTYHEFWEEDVSKAVAYRRAEDIRKSRQNQYMWLQGRYIYDALCEASPLFNAGFAKGRVEAHDYTKEPYPITKAELEEREERERKAQMERWKAQFMEFSTRIAAKMTTESRPSDNNGGDIENGGHD